MKEKLYRYLTCQKISTFERDIMGISKIKVVYYTYYSNFKKKNQQNYIFYPPSDSTYPPYLHFQFKVLILLIHSHKIFQYA